MSSSSTCRSSVKYAAINILSLSEDNIIQGVLLMSYGSSFLIDNQAYMP
jgi:hypothetical protein